MRRMSACLLVVACLASPALAGDGADADALAGAMPAQITEVTTTGTWQDGGRSGTYRALVVMGETAGKPHAKVYLQWIDGAPPAGGSAIAASKPIDQINALNVPNASLAMDSEAKNEVTLLVQSYDPNAESSLSFSVTATLPGQLTVSEGGGTE